MNSIRTTFEDIYTRGISENKEMFAKVTLLDKYSTDGGFSVIDDIGLAEASQLDSFYLEYENVYRELVEEFSGSTNVKLLDMFDLYSDDVSEEVLSFFQLVKSKRYKELIVKKAELLSCLQQVTPDERYEYEYKQEDGLCPYQYYSPLMNKDIFTKITGIDDFGGDKTYLEIGAGSGLLVSLLKSWGVSSKNIGAIEPSSNAVSEIKRLGINNSYVGKSQDARELIKGQFDTVLLSYFVDRDPDQVESFRNSVSLLSEEGGKIILEGLLPVNPFDSQGMRYAGEETLLTRGDSVSKDCILLIGALEKMGEEFGFVVETTTIGLGYRLVSTIVDGIEVLPSTVISMDLTKKLA